MNLNITKTFSYRICSFEEAQKYVKDFNCGNIRINNYLKNEAKYYEIAKTYLFFKEVSIINKDSSKIIEKQTYLIGFFSLCSDTLLEEEIITYTDTCGIKHEHKEIKQIGSAIRINMFAIDERYQGIKEVYLNDSSITYAHCMLILCFNIIEEIVKNYLGATYIVLYSTEKGEGLYKYVGGFDELDPSMSIPKTNADIKLKPLYRVIFEDD